ncbi:hypothetical protein RhiirC2_712714 [Rhizophagus irregularis]|uniref:Uncharacterized protein n=1 Tax=Rhizophagus irregularis TaxID=588596 RepID=A0A2N1N687_9GLOM|nr:hypothetical protein RhiirC2_712714 [Rhizophagus irregularis]
MAQNRNISNLPKFRNRSRNFSQIRNSEIRNSSRNAEIKYVNLAGIMHLIPAGIIEFPKMEIDITQDSIFVPTKIDFCGTAIAKYRNDRRIVLTGITIFGWNYEFGRNYELISEKFRISDSEFRISDFCQINFGAILKIYT